MDILLKNGADIDQGDLVRGDNVSIFHLKDANVLISSVKFFSFRSTCIIRVRLQSSNSVAIDYVSTHSFSSHRVVSHHYMPPVVRDTMM